MSNTTTTSGTEHHCFACGVLLVPVLTRKFYPEFPDAKFDPYTGHKLDTGAFNDALTITFTGGYGEYFDDNPCEVIICNSCADDLRQSDFWVDHIMNWLTYSDEGETLIPFYQIVENSKADHPTNHEALGKLLHANPKSIVKPFLSLVKDPEQ